MSVAVLWADGEIIRGVDATDCLSRMLGGWNPNTVIELRHVLARRAMLDNFAQLNDQEFLQALDAQGALTFQQIRD